MEFRSTINKQLKLKKRIKERVTNGTILLKAFIDKSYDLDQVKELLKKNYAEILRKPSASGIETALFQTSDTEIIGHVGSYYHIKAT